MCCTGMQLLSWCRRPRWLRSTGDVWLLVKPIDCPVDHHQIPTNGIRLHVAQVGPASGPLVLLLYGFPEF